MNTHLQDLQAVGEWRDVQHVQQGSLRCADLVTSGDDVNVIDDFNSTFGNLRWNRQRLEERGFLLKVEREKSLVGALN